MNKFTIKNPAEIEIMAEAGKRLHEVKKQLSSMIAEGVSAKDIEDKAQELIKSNGGKPSFMMVDNYHWATCININEGLVHGIPTKELVFKKGDVVSIDLGLYYKGFHSDTSNTILIGSDQEKEKFLQTGRQALKKAIDSARVGRHIWDISHAIETVVSKAGYSPIEALVGHGIGKNLHEEPAIPCFTSSEPTDTPEIKEGMAIAIEVMYSMGSPKVGIASDGWTISMRDGKISALYEETVAITKHGPVVLT